MNVFRAALAAVGCFVSELIPASLSKSVMDVPADRTSAGPGPGVVDDGLATTAPTPGHLHWGRSESDGPDLTQGTRPVAAARSDFRGCNCDSHHAADLDDHQPRCGAHSWARMHRIISEFLATADVFPTHELQDAMAARLTDSLHQK